MSQSVTSAATSTTNVSTATTVTAATKPTTEPDSSDSEFEDSVTEETEVMETFNLPTPLSGEGNLDHNWKAFKEEFGIYMVASEKTKKSKEVQAAIFLNLIGEYGRGLFKNFNMAEADKKDLEKIAAAFENFCEPKKNVIYERFKFNQRSQEAGETFDNFLTAIQKLIRTCDYGDHEDAILRDRIVIGINDTKLQEKLLGREDEMDSVKVIALCRAAELARTQAKDMRGQKTGCIDSISKDKNKFQGKFNKFDKSKFDTRHNKNNQGQKTKCFRCDRSHEANNCPAKGKTCNRCGKSNHFAKVCTAKESAVKPKDKKVSHVTVSQEKSDDDDFDYDSLFIGSVNLFNESKSWIEVIKINGVSIKVKIDTGAEANCMNLKVFKRITANKVKLHLLSENFDTYGGGKLKAVGICFLLVEHGIQKLLQEFKIFDNDDVTLFGLESCELFGFVSRSKDKLCSMVNPLREKFILANKDVFEGIGTFREVCSLKLKDNACPVIKPGRRIPRALYARLKSTLNDFVKRGIVKPIEDEDIEWVHNLVVREKPDKNLRVCLDPKELNASLKPMIHPIPRSEEINSKLAGKKVFTVLDCKEGFYHFLLDEASANLCTFNTVFGCYKFLRLPFGVSIAPQLFQKVNEKNFANIDGVIVYIDDILIAAETEEEHDRILNKVLKRARELNIKFNEGKVQYKVKEVKYLGHKYSEHGIMIDEDRVQAIQDLKEPQTKKELQSILGMINFIRGYIPQISEISSPLRELLKKNVIFKWLPAHAKVLSQIKNLISTAPVLGIFDENKEITVQADASKNGLGACLMQEGRPIAYASRSLTDAEKRYAQIEKELLGIVFACRKFHFYIYGKDITLQTDHKPLEGIFKKDIGDIPSVRLQNMRMKLLRYKLQIVHVPGKLMHVADLLSRSFSPNHIEYEDEVNVRDVIHTVNMSDEKKLRFQLCTENDEVLREVKRFCLEGWPRNKRSIPEAFGSYYKIRGDIYLDDKLLFFGDRVIVPLELRAETLKLIHEGHQGIVKTKLRAKSLVYWPGINNDIEVVVSNCRTCEKFRRANQKEFMIPHPIPERPFQKVGADIAEHGAKQFLIAVDYFSKWLEIVPIAHKHSGEVIKKFKEIFATHGIPEVVMADNMPFASFELKQFAKNWDFKITTSSPTYQQSNGQAEKAVHIAKSMIKKSVEENTDFHIPLLEYRNTPIPGIGFSPAQILMSRVCRSKLPIKDELLKPRALKGVKEILEKLKAKSCKYYDRNARQRESIVPGDEVVVKRGKTWEPAKVINKANTPRSLIIETDGGQTLRRNMIHLRKSKRVPRVESKFETVPMSAGIPKEETVAVREDNKPTPPSNNVKFTRIGRPVIQPERYGFPK